MSLKLKIDLHIHSAEDMSELVAGRTDLISAKKFIASAVSQKFDAISFTHHGMLFHDAEVTKYAEEKGLILIPGVEAFINKMHVLLINFTEKKFVFTFDELKQIKHDEMVVIAPHPYYLASICLGKQLEKHLELFDGVEYCRYYYKLFNLNRKAVRIAQKYQLPLIGNSDAHHLRQFGTTYSYVYSEKKSIPAIISAIKQGRVEYVSHPPAFNDFVHETKWLFEKVPYEIQMLMRRVFRKSSYKIKSKLPSILNQIIR